MGVFAGGLWFAYTEGAAPCRDTGRARADIPLIRADNGPIRVKPENPGGMQIPDRDMLIYGQQRPQIEHLLPPPEQPMARPAPPPLSPNPAPPQVQTAAEGPPAATQTPPAEAGRPTVAAVTPPAPDAIAQKLEQLAAAPVANSLPSSPARAAPARTGGLRLQLAAVRSESEARGEWARLKHQNADLLGKLSAVALRADLGGKGIYYRIEAGPVADAPTADRICGELRQRRLACIIVR